MYQADQTSQQSIFGVQTNFHLYTKSGLADGPHNLKVNITACTNQRFSLDYITYTPSFNSGAQEPTISTPAGQTPGSSSSHFPTGAIAGIVVGAVVLIAAAGLILWLCKRRRKTAAEPFPTSSSTLAITRKEEVPPHMRQLRAPSSRDTLPNNTVDLTDESMSNGAWVLAPHPSDVRNINELVAPPPAYGNRNTAMSTDTAVETTIAPTSRSP